MKFIIRDDDLNYFSKPADIERWYDDVFEQKIPVGFSVISFVKPISDVYPRNLPAEDKEYPISKNHELIEYIKNNPFIEVMQHGCTHETKNGIFEFRRGKGLFGEVRRGRAELKKAFGTKVNIFVPPHDSIYSHGIHAVEAAGMNIIRGIGSKNFLFRSQYLKAILKMTLYKIRFPIKSRMPAYPYVIDFGKHKEAYANRLNNDNYEELLKRLNYVQKKNGNFIITAHIHSFTEKKKENLTKLIKKAQELGAEFVKPSELFNSK